MNISCEYLSYETTGHFTTIINDYVKKDHKLASFFNYDVSLNGIREAIAARKNFKTDRKILVQELRKQYEGITLSAIQEKYLTALLSNNTFTICTAHQPVIFTGPVYFIYKIFHAIKLADILNKQLPENVFVPVFYMGSEDADLDELGHINVDGNKLTWETKQTGSVGRMKVDKSLLKLIDKLANQLEVEQFGKELIELFRSVYKEGISLQHATFILINELFKKSGLLVLIPDNAVLKSLFTPVVKKELTEQFSQKIVQETIADLSTYYKQQAGGREINLFYMQDGYRERIEKDGKKFIARSVSLSWSNDEILKETEMYPERFSANVILRPLFQEMILPNIIFIGGGGETAYWLELKKLFEATGVHYPMIVLRNSFLFVNEKQQEQAASLKMSINMFFKEINIIVNELVKRESNNQLTLENERQKMDALYEAMQLVAGKIDITLAKHTEALKKGALKKIELLEKKMLRKEKLTFEAQQRQVEKLKQQLFPNGSLQERVENFSVFYARYGKAWMQAVYNCSQGLEQEFTIALVK